MGAYFRVFLAEFTWPWAPTPNAMVLLKFFWNLGYHPESLKPLIDLFAYLEPKLSNWAKIWLKNLKNGSKIKNWAKIQITRKVTLSISA